MGFWYSFCVILDKKVLQKFRLFDDYGFSSHKQFAYFLFRLQKSHEVVFAITPNIIEFFVSNVFGAQFELLKI